MSSSRYEPTAASRISESVEDLQSVQAHLEVIRRLVSAQQALLNNGRLKTVLHLDCDAQPFVRTPLFARETSNRT